MKNIRIISILTICFLFLPFVKQCKGMNYSANEATVEGVQNAQAKEYLKIE